MKNNLWEIALQGKKSEHRLLFFSYLFCVVLLTAAFVLTGSLRKSNEEARFGMYGRYKGAVYQVDEETKEKLKDHAALTDWGEMHILAALKSQEKTVGYAGIVDDALIALGNISLEEGRLPQSPEEIAMESSLLDALGIRPVVGQRCSFCWASLDTEAGEARTEERSYLLCGILKPYTAGWDSEGNMLCGALLAKETKDMPACTHLFFDSTHNSREEMEELRELIPLGRGMRLVYNTFAYPPQIGFTWYIESRAILLFTFLMSLMFLFLTQVILFPRRRYKDQVLRLLGADRRMLIQIRIRESIAVWFTAFFAGTACTVLFLVGAFLLWRQFCNIQFTLHIQLLSFLAAAAASFLASMGANFYPFLLMDRFSMVPEQKSTAFFQARRPRKKPDGFLSRRSFYRREAFRYRKQNCLEALFLFMAVVLFLSGFFAVHEKYRRYQIGQKLLGQDYEWSAAYPAGLSEEQLDEIRSVEGITSVESCTVVGAYRRKSLWVGYDGWREDAYFLLDKWYQSMSKEEMEDMQGMPGRLVMLPRDSDLFSYYTGQEAFEITREEFEAGEAAVIYLPDLLVDAYGGTAYINNLDATTYKPFADPLTAGLTEGDTLYISLGDRKAQIACKGILKRFHNLFQESRDFLMPGDVLVSEAFLERFMDQAPQKRNYVMAYGSADMLSETTDKKLDGISAGPQIVFSSFWQQKNSNREEFLRTLLLAGTFMFFVFCLSVLFCLHSHMGRKQKDEARTRLLIYLGMEKEGLLRLCYFPFLRRLIFLVSVDNVLVFSLFLKTVGRIDGYVSRADWLRAAFGMGTIGFSWPLYMGIQALFMGLLAFGLYRIYHER